MNEVRDIAIEHPLEGVLDIDAGTTLVPLVERNTELVVSPHFDEKDNEIEGQMQEVYDAAMVAFETQSLDSEKIEPKYRARNQEIASQFLTTALNAANSKATLKQHKDKLNVATAKAQHPDTVHNNLIVADRNDILRHLVKSVEASKG